MSRGFIRRPSFWKIVGAYRSQWKRLLMRALFPNTYGKKGMGWWTKLGLSRLKPQVFVLKR